MDDRFEIITRSAKINAEIQAKNLPRHGELCSTGGR
jgi:hypothetical protein